MPEKRNNISPAPEVAGERIAMLLFRNKLTVAALGRAMNKDRATMSTKINGHRRWYLDELVSIAAILDTTVGFLLGETDDDSRPSHLPGANKSTPITKSDEGASSGLSVAGAGLEPATSRL